MAKIGYCRVSTEDQNLERQMIQLQKQGCQKIFAEKVSGATMTRPSLQEMLSYIREGDIVIVTELDRLGRNNEDLTKILRMIQDKGASFEALSLPTLRGIQDESLRKLFNNFVLELFSYIAENERKRIRERQRQGIEIAKKEGRFHGRKRLFSETSPRLQHAFSLLKAGFSLKKVSEMTGISLTTLKRYVKLYYSKIP